MTTPPTVKRRICFVTGTRAEFGLMRTTLDAIRQHPRLRLQLVVTGMHLDPRYGDGLADIRRHCFHVDAVVPWSPQSSGSPSINAANTGLAFAKLAEVFERLQSDVVLVVGDRVEAFAAAAAAHLSHRIVAHVHGGDRALGQTDDSLRHAITKLAHVHFPATPRSAKRIQRLGEHPDHIHLVGSPGNDAIRQSAASWKELHNTFPSLRKRQFALLVLHPVQPDPFVERRYAQAVLQAIRQSSVNPVVVVYPNNDPGSTGIIGLWEELAQDPRFIVCPNLPRSIFLALLRHAAVLIGNSSSGIIEAASFNTPVLDIGPRQAGRERGSNVFHCNYTLSAIARSLRFALASPRRPSLNMYGTQGAGRRIAKVLAHLDIGPQLLAKLIRY